MEEKVAVVTSRTFDFVTYVSQIYEGIKGNLTQNGRLITIEHDNAKTTYYHVMALDHCSGIAFDRYVAFRSDAVEHAVIEHLEQRGVTEK